LIAIKCGDAPQRADTFDARQSLRCRSVMFLPRRQGFGAMSLKTILVELNVDGVCAPRISYAWGLAQDHGAELIGFCAAEPHFVMPSGKDDSAASQDIWR
jgi:nucleotide-binding universal stress UspA family protein